MTYCGQEEITPHRNMSRPSASIKVSMNCDYSGFSQGQTTDLYEKYYELDTRLVEN
jgi:hypothetical protein